MVYGNVAGKCIKKAVVQLSCSDFAFRGLGVASPIFYMRDPVHQSPFATQYSTLIVTVHPTQYCNRKMFRSFSSSCSAFKNTRTQELAAHIYFQYAPPVTTVIPRKLKINSVLSTTCKLSLCPSYCSPGAYMAFCRISPPLA